MHHCNNYFKSLKICVKFHIHKIINGTKYDYSWACCIKYNSQYFVHLFRIISKFEQKNCTKKTAINLFSLEICWSDLENLLSNFLKWFKHWKFVSQIVDTLKKMFVNEYNF